MYCVAMRLYHDDEWLSREFFVPDVTPAVLTECREALTKKLYTYETRGMGPSYIRRTLLHGVFKL